jgi:4-hydroxy-2-oxoheptanedioate aldolase
MPHCKTATMLREVTVASIAACLALAAAAAGAQERTQYLNPIIEKLAKGQPFIGVSTSDLSVDNAKALSRAPIDYVYLEMEHALWDYDSLERFTLATIDRAAIHERGNLQSDIAIIGRFPPYGANMESNQWIAKQALDAGYMGIIFPAINSAEEALNAVSSMRYPQALDSAYPEPAGIRGSGAGRASWLWGISGSEYSRVADLWPLNPDGELIAIMMCEGKGCVENIDAITQVPGVGGIFIGESDLSNSMGVAANSEEANAAVLQILEGCKRNNVACGKTFDAEEMAEGIDQGFLMLNLGGANGGLTASNAASLSVAQEKLGLQ